MAEPGGRGLALGTLSARVIGLSALMTLAIISAAFTLTYFSATRILEQETEEVVAAELSALIGSDRSADLGDLKREINRRSTDESEAVYLLVWPDGHKEAGNLNGWPAGVRTDGQWMRLNVIRASTGDVIEIGAVALVSVPQGMRLLVGRDLKAQRSFQGALIEAGAVALIAAMLLAGASGFVLNRLVMSRIRDIDSTASAIVAGDLTRRIPVRPGGDEFSRLALTLNGMLERIEVLVVELRTVTDSLSHDLRTPLTRLTTQIQRSMDADLPETARREALGQAADEADRILASFTAMIDIARAEAGTARDQFTAVDIVAVVRDVFELHQPLAEEMSVKLTFHADGPVMVQGHAQFLAQLVSNLVDNALKHGAGGRVITMAVRRVIDMAEIEVADRGAGIPPEQREQALKRFGRLDAARTTSGSGLGLSLAATLARMHGGELLLEDNAPGLRVRVRMPAAG